MIIRAIGGFEVLNDDREVVPLQRQCRRLVALLYVSSKTGLSIDAIVDALWGGEPPATARQTVHVLVNRVRTALGDGAIISTGSGYQLGINGSDLAELSLEIERLRVMHRVDAARACNELALLLTVVDEQVFAGFQDDQFLHALIHQHDEAMCSLEELWAQWAINGACGASEIERMRVMAERQPLRERRWELLMMALYRDDRQADALAAFERARVELRDQLGVMPGSKLRQLSQAILDQQNHLEHDNGSMTTSAGERFIGRSDELVNLEWAASNHRLTTVLGIGGIGKTRLVEEFAHRRLLRGSVSCTIGISEGMKLIDAALAVVTRLNPNAADGSDDAIEIAVGLLRDIDLLVVDSAERSHDAAASLVSTLVSRCPRLTVIVTSRVPLGVASEQLVEVGPLNCAGGIGSDAFRMFLDRSHQHIEHLSNEQTDRIQQFVQRTSGHPILIELTASRLSVEEQEPEDPLGEAERFAIEHAISDALALIDPMASGFLSALSVMPRGMSLHCASAWLGDDQTARRMVHQLRSVRLVTSYPGEAAVRYRVLDPIAEVLRESCDSSVLDAIFDRGIEVLGPLFQGLRPEASGPLEMERLTLLDDEHDNLRRVIDYWLDRGDGERALRLCMQAIPYWWHRRATVGMCLDRVRRSLETTPQTAVNLYRGLNAIGDVACDIWQVARHLPLFEQALVHPDRDEVPSDEVVKVLCWAAVARGFNGDIAGADELIDRAAPMIATRWMRLHHDTIVALRRVFDGDPEGCRASLREVGRGFEDLADFSAATTATYLAAAVGDLVRASDVMLDVGEARRLAALSGTDRMDGRLLFLEAETMLSERGVGAVPYLERAAIVLERSGFFRQAGLAHRNLGLLLRDLGRDVDARLRLVAGARLLIAFSRADAAIAVAAIAAYQPPGAERNALAATAVALAATQTLVWSMEDRQRLDQLLAVLSDCDPALPLENAALDEYLARQSSHAGMA